MFWHWLNVHLWAPMWPNMFAPSVITLAWVGILHLRTRVHLRRVHQIAADTHKHLTGEEHPAAPRRSDGQADPA